MGLAQSVLTLAVGVAIQQVGVGILMPLGNIYIHKTFADDKLGFPTGVYMVSQYVGVSLAALAETFALDYGWRVSVFMYASFAFTCWMLAVILAQLDDVDEETSLDAGEGSKLMPAKNAAEEAEEEEAEASGAGGGCANESSTPLPQGDLPGRTIKICLIFIGGATRYMAGLALGDFIPLFYTIAFHRDATFATDRFLL